MSLIYGQLLSSEDVINLKAKIKAELSRRNQNTDISSYGGPSYDFSSNPDSGDLTSYEYIDKILTPLRAVNEDTVFSIYGPIYIGSPTKALGSETGDSINAFVTSLQGDTFSKGGTHHCKASCSGMCSTTCQGNCSNGCTNGCYGSCTGNCSSCGGYCSSSCSGDCEGTSTGSCGSLCAGTCSGSCGNCGGGGSSCSGSSTNCSNCAGTCKTSSS